MLSQIIAAATAGIENTFRVPLPRCPDLTPPEKEKEVVVVIVSRRTPEQIEEELTQVREALANLWRDRRHEIQDAYTNKVMEAAKYGGIVFDGFVGPNRDLSKMRKTLDDRREFLEHELRFALSYERNPKAYQRS